jgi:U3 small nucleolar RNA-associated protein 25
MSRLLLPEKGQVVNKPRFYEEFGDEDDADKEKEKKNSRKPEDHEQLFAGNTDDSFRIGIAVAKRTLKVVT